jgi:hypothetical protein
MMHQCKDMPYRDVRGSGYEIEKMENGFWRFRIIGALPPPKKLEVVCYYCLMCGGKLD